MSLDWMVHAACRGKKPELWFPLQPLGGHRSTVVELPAKRICWTCPVRSQCLRYGMDNETPSYRWGIYGGLNSAERQELFREMKR